MRRDRLLTQNRSEAGSAAVESTFALLLLLGLVLGTIEVAFALYGRNVILSAAHEGARAAVELGRDPSEAAAIARSTVSRSAGGVVDDLDVHVEITDGDPIRVAVRVSGIVDAWGPVPLPIPVTTVARATTEGIER